MPDPIPSTVEIPLWGRGGVVRAVTLVDGSDADALNEYRWAMNRTFYAVRKSTMVNRVQSSILMHRQILGLQPGDGLQGDHINCDRLDNRRANLRIVSIAQNSQNRRSGYGSSEHRGVSWSKRERRWRATGKVNGQAFHLGAFVDELDAARAAADWRAVNHPFSTEALECREEAA